MDQVEVIQELRIGYCMIKCYRLNGNRGGSSVEKHVNLVGGNHPPCLIIG